MTLNLGTAQIIQGNALNLPLPDASVDLICTSPPYFGLRSYQDTPQLCSRCLQLTGQIRPYGNDAHRNLREAWPDWDAHVAEFHKPIHYEGQIGSEATPAEFLEALLAATREMVRVLKPTGSIFVNLGDKYVSSSNGTIGHRAGSRVNGLRPRGSMDTPVPVKSLMGFPWRYAIQCIDQLGLILRAEIIWSKPNGLPESVTDRVRRSHEQWFHFTKQPRYYAAVDEIRDPQLLTGGDRPKGSWLASTNGINHRDTRTAKEDYNPLGKLPGSVWSIPSQPLTVPPELGVDHFAAYPMEWPRRIIQGWTPTGICTACDQPRTPIVATQQIPSERGGTTGHKPGRRDLERPNGEGYGDTGKTRFNQTHTISSYTCGCGEWPLDAVQPSTTPAVVLDPFGGTGTTALVAKALGRTGITIDLSADYCRLAEWRTNDPRELAAALQVEKPDPVHPDQLDLFGEYEEPKTRGNKGSSLIGIQRVTCETCGYRSQNARATACEKCGAMR